MTRSPFRVQPPTVKVWRLYRFYDAGGTLLYIGQTGRMPLERLIEHLYEQGWAPEIARWEVDPRVWHSEADALAAEEAAIRAEKPRYNWQHNDGPHRVWVPKVGHYRHPGRRAGVPVAGRSPVEAVLRSPWTWWLSVWVVAAVLLWWLLGVAAAHAGIGVPGASRLAVSAGLAAAAVARLWWVVVGRRWWRRVKRRR